MSSEQLEALLPLNEKIDHLGKVLILKRKIGEGYTSVVYEGELGAEEQTEHVAVKARKELDFPGARENFRQEAMTLARFMDLEEIFNKKTGTPGLKVTPKFFGKSEYKAENREVDYIVMEFIQGEELPALLKKERTMPEKDALVAAGQFFRVLDILHTEFKKVFIDLKLENLWWVAPGESLPAQLKVTDLGTLAEIKSPGQVEHDLLLGGIILFTLLTGVIPRYSVYGLNERIEPILKNYSMSWGTRQVVHRLLHRSPSQRYTGAAEIVNKLRRLSDFWASSDVELEEVVLANQEEALKSENLASPESREFVRNARAALDILALRSPQYKPEEIRTSLENVEKLLVKSDFLGIGMDLFRGGSWQKAGEMFEQGKEWSSEPVVLRRWGYLTKAMAGNKIPEDQLPEYREQAIQAVEWLNSEDWAAARQRIQELLPMLNSAGAEVLLAECDFAEKLKNGDDAKNDEKYELAAQYYQEALTALAKLPDQEFIQKVEIGDLRATQVEMERLERTRGQAGELLRQAREAADDSQFEDAQQKFSQAYEADPEHPDLAKDIVQAARAAFDLQNLEAAESILAVSLKLSHIPNELTADWQAVQVLRSAQRALKEGQHETFASYIRRAWSEHLLSEQVLREQVAVNVHSLLKNLDNYARQIKDARLLELAADLIEDAPGDESAWATEVRQISNELHNQKDAELRKNIDRNIAYATSLINLEMQTIGKRSDLLTVQQYLADKSSRLAEARKLILDAEQMSRYLDFRSQDIAGLKTRIEQEIQQTTDESTVNSRQALEAESRRLFDALQAAWEHIERLNKWMLEGGALGCSESVQRAAAGQIGEELRRIIPQARHLLAHYAPQDVRVKEILDTATRRLSCLGAQGWQALAEEAQKQMAQIEQDFKAARTAFEQGKLEEAAAELDRQEINCRSSQEWLQLKADVSHVTAFAKWQEEHQATLQTETTDPDLNLLVDLHKMIAEKSIPKAYWQESPVRGYLIRLDQWIRKEAMRRITNAADRQFFSLLVNWVKLEHLLRQAGVRRGTE